MQILTGSCTEKQISLIIMGKEIVNKIKLNFKIHN